MDKGPRHKPPPCRECGHSSVVHRKNGACYGDTRCLCGWTRDMHGALRVKSTGDYAGQSEIGYIGTWRPSPGDVARKRNKGVKMGVTKRRELLQAPCHFCGGKGESLDHFFPRSKGGLNDRSNLVSACFVCNAMKGDKTYEELLVFCREMETAVSNSKSLRKIRTFATWKEQAKKVLAWYELKLKVNQAPVP